jgi:Domain of unknown function (DUF1905)
MTASVSFDTRLSAVGNNTGIEVPDHKMAELGAGKRPAVVVTVNGHEYRSTVGAMGGKQLVSVSAASARKQVCAAVTPFMSRSHSLTAPDKSRSRSTSKQLAKAPAARPSSELRLTASSATRSTRSTRQIQTKRDSDASTKPSRCSSKVNNEDDATVADTGVLQAQAVTPTVNRNEGAPMTTKKPAGELGVPKVQGLRICVFTTR